MQNLHLKHTLRSELSQSYLNAIKVSIEHFSILETHFDKIQAAQNQDPKNFFEPLAISKINYIALMALEKLGLIEPTQEQIDIIEILIMLAIETEHLTPEKFDFCTDVDTVARRTFLRHISKRTYSM